MAKCVRCGKFSLFKSFQNGLCNDCLVKIEEEEKERKQREIQEQKRRELEEKRRIEEKEAEKKRMEELLKLPDRLFGDVLSYDYEDVNLFVPDSSAFEKMQIGTRLNAYQDKSNQHDQHAVRLEWNRDTLAYFYRGKLQDMANDYIEFGGQVHGIVTALYPEDKKIQAHIGYYKGKNQDEYRSLVKTNIDAKKFKLTGNSSEAKQSNIMISRVGEKCELEYDTEKDKYIVCNGDEIGCLPSSASKMIEDHGEENCSVFISEIDINDSGKYSVCVSIFCE